nr:MAG TPA: excisionase [Caudoviricetes sp.]
MDDYLLHELGRSLYSLERNGAGLEELLTFHRGSSTTDTPGRAVCYSKPPVNLTVLDLLVQTEALLSFWSSEVLACGGDGVVGPVPEGIASVAAWLQRYLDVADGMPWGEMMAEEVIAQARMVASVVEPDSGREEPSPPEWATCQVAASWARQSGVQVSRTTVYRWAQAGKVATTKGDDGGMLVRLDDVLARAGAMRGAVSFGVGQVLV